MSSKQQVEKVTIEYKGKKYHRYPNSKRRQLRVYYWRHDKWKQPPVSLHRQIYEDNFGPIPEGYCVHHKDGNPENNDPSNLTLLSHAEHMSYESKQRWDDPEWRKRRTDYYASAEYRRKASEAQKNRKKSKVQCQLCGETFITGNNSKHVRWCPECRKMQYSDKNGVHFRKSKQIARFGKVVVPYDQSIATVRLFGDFSGV